MNMTRRLGVALTAMAVLAGAGCESTGGKAPAARAGTRVARTNYHGWADALLLRSATTEVVVAPAIGRVLQFGFAGEEGVFWENRALDGQTPPWNPKDWVNFGGDKTWPAPEGEWSKQTKFAGWRPPPGFDGMAAQARVEGGDVILTTPVDPSYGIRATRRMHLDAQQPVLTITTTYERVSGEPSKVGIWVITQLKEPVGIYVPGPPNATAPKSYTLLMKEPPPSLKAGNGMVSLTRNPQASHKVGSEAGALVWVGEKAALRIDSPRVSGAEYPDQGSSAEVYTNPDPLKYIELEMLGPLRTLAVGEKMERVNTYTLYRRTGATAEAEARRILNR